MEPDEDTLAADLWAFVEEGEWFVFLRWAKERGYSEAKIERLGAAIKAKAGRG